MRRLLLSAAFATVATTLTSLFLGKRHAKSAAAPLSAASHIIWGPRAFKVKRFDVKHTLVGGLVHTVAMGFWAGVLELIVRPRKYSPVEAIGYAGAVTAAAWLTDYALVPRRLTPGFEAHLDGRGLLHLYAALAAGLAAGLVVGPAEPRVEAALQASWAHPGALSLGRIE